VSLNLVRSHKAILPPSSTSEFSCTTVQMGATHSFKSTSCCDCGGHRKEEVDNLRHIMHTRPWSKDPELNKLEKQHTSLRRGVPAIEKTHRGELTKAIAQHEKDLETIEDIYEEIRDVEQRMKIVKPKLQSLEQQVKDTTGQTEHYELAQELFKLQNQKSKLALRIEQWKRKAEDDHEKVKALRQVVAEERDKGCARYTTSRDRVSSSPDPGGRRSTSPQAGVRNTSRRGTMPDSGRRSTSPEAGVRNTSRRSTSPDSARRSSLSEASHGPDGKKNSLTANKFQSIDSLRDTGIEVDHANLRKFKLLSVGNVT
jgi:hypothetical protein